MNFTHYTIIVYFHLTGHCFQDEIAIEICWSFWFIDFCNNQKEKYVHSFITFTKIIWLVNVEMFLFLIDKHSHSQSNIRYWHESDQSQLGQFISNRKTWIQMQEVRITTRNNTIWTHTALFTIMMDELYHGNVQQHSWKLPLGLHRPAKKSRIISQYHCHLSRNVSVRSRVISSKLRRVKGWFTISSSI